MGHFFFSMHFWMGSTIFGQVHLVSWATHLAKFMALATSCNSDSFWKKGLAKDKTIPYHLKHLRFAKSTRLLGIRCFSGNVFGMSVSLERSLSWIQAVCCFDLPQTYLAWWKLLRLMLIMQSQTIENSSFSPATSSFWSRSTLIDITCGALAGLGASPASYMADEARPDHGNMTIENTRGNIWTHHFSQFKRHFLEILRCPQLKWTNPVGCFNQKWHCIPRFDFMATDVFHCGGFHASSMVGYAL